MHQSKVAVFSESGGVDCGERDAYKVIKVTINMKVSMVNSTTVYNKYTLNVASCFISFRI